VQLHYFFVIVVVAVDIEQLNYFFVVVVAVVLPHTLLLDHRSILPEKVD
jgi:hypothetical protein